MPKADPERYDPASAGCAFLCFAVLVGMPWGWEGILLAALAASLFNIAAGIRRTLRGTP